MITLQQQIFAANNLGGELRKGGRPEGGRVFEKPSMQIGGRAKQKRVNQGLAKISQNKSEKQPSALRCPKRQCQAASRRRSAHTTTARSASAAPGGGGGRGECRPEDPRSTRPGKTVQDKRT